MMTEVTVKKWGNSMGIILPKQVVEKEHLKNNQKIVVQIVKVADLTSIFGSLKLGESPQKLKDRGRKIWNY